MNLPEIPYSFDKFASFLASTEDRQGVSQVLEPFKTYEAKLREVFAQEPDHPTVTHNHLVPVYQNGKTNLKIRARDLSTESKEEQERYLLPLSADQRRQNGSNAVTSSLGEFHKNFSIFSESALSDLDWNNVVAAGSSVVTALLPVDIEAASKRALRTYYHEQLAPASDVDLFIYGLNEEQAIEKIKTIEANIRDALLSETTVIRTKNAITIISEYPVRHIQIVLRLYKSVSEILTGFDVDCACVAYDGSQVWASPRALAAFVTQANSIDLTRRSPSYENRLSKYAHRGFEVYWPLLDRSRVDPTIYERAFRGVKGLARLLVLEKLPHPQDRDEYSAKRREERGRPSLPWDARYRNKLPGNVKDAQPDDVAEWIEDEELSSYHTFAIPYGPRYTPKKIERLLFQQDLLKNAEWNRSKDRETTLHRHPAFFGSIEDVIDDCCGYCPKPVTDADLAAWEEESKIFVSGKVSFLKDDPGRQSIGSFHPLTDDDWTEMAYIGSTGTLCQAIVEKNLDGVTDWFGTEGADVNQRDHTGRTPLQLAVMCSSPEIVQCLIDHGARIVARLYNGLTALHLAAWRGSPDMVRALMEKSAQNEADEDAKEEMRKKARREAKQSANSAGGDVEMADVHSSQDDAVESDNEEDLMDANSDTSSEDRMTGSFVKLDKDSDANDEIENDKDDPDFYDIDVVAWDSPCSALHLAIIAGHGDVIRLLIDEYSADVMLPVKLMTNDIPRQAYGAILPLLLPMDLPLQRASETIKTLVERGASPVQATTNHTHTLHYVVDRAKIELLRLFTKLRPEIVAKAINKLIVTESTNVIYPLLSAIRSKSAPTVQEVISLGAKHTIEFEEFVRAYNANASGRNLKPDELEKIYKERTPQPVIEAAQHESMIDMVIPLVESGADVNTLTPGSWMKVHNPNERWRAEAKTLLNVVQDHRKRLEDFVAQESNKPKPELKRPEELENDEHYLQGLQKGTYQYWTATKDLENAKYIQYERAKRYQHKFDIESKNIEPTPEELEKRRIAAASIEKFKSVEMQLIAKGAKPFHDIYPDIKTEENNYYNNYNNGMSNHDGTAFKIKFEFAGRDVSPAKQDIYLQLFEAAFAGDIETVKRLCLFDNDNGQPLLVSAEDHNELNPFAIAVLRGHLDLAEVILDIAAAQYEDRKEAKRICYSSQPFDTSSEGEDSTDEGEEGEADDEILKFYKRIVSEKFTIDDMDTLGNTIKSRTSPLNLIQQEAHEVWRILPVNKEEAVQQCRVGKGFEPEPYIYTRYGNVRPWRTFQSCWEVEHFRVGTSLIKYAVITNNLKLLEFLLEMEVKYSPEDSEDLLKSMKDRKDILHLAMNLGQLDIIDKILRHRGPLLPLHHLAQRYGVVIEEIPKYYQGLTVYGQKRKDWTNQDRYEVDKSETASPLLDAIMEGNLDVIDYFMSDIPLRRYEEFCSRFKKDHRVRALIESKGGTTATLKSWMSTRINLALHVAVMSWPAGSSHKLEYLLEKLPSQYLETRSASGDTPLHLALKLGNLPAFEILLAAGANQRTRDKKGNNLLHTIYGGAREHELALFKKVIGMLDQSILKTLLTEKCSHGDSGLYTPLALYLQGSHNESNFKMLGYMLELSQGNDLTIMNGAGDYPLHEKVRQNHRRVAKYLAKKRPDLLYLENSTGMTPMQVAETRYLQARLDHEPSIKNSSDHNQGFLRGRHLSSISHVDTDGKTEAGNDNLPLSDQMYSQLISIARQNPQPRRLVSVLDANEVARRLALRQQRKNAESRLRQAQGLKSWRRQWRRSTAYGDQAGENTNDEVNHWSAEAQRNIGRLPFDGKTDGDDLEMQLQKWRDFAAGRMDVWTCCDRAELETEQRNMHKKMTKEIGVIFE